MIAWMELIGVLVFAISGTLSAGRRRMDLFGVLVVAVITAIGGGTLRDLLLGRTPVFWVVRPVQLYVAAGGGAITFLLARYLIRWPAALLVADAAGMALFTVLGTLAALQSHAPGPVAAILGVITGVAGGIIRDVLCARVPLVLRREVYATAALAGAILVVALLRWPALPPTWSGLLGAATAFAIRVIALWRNLALPTFSLPSR